MLLCAGKWVPDAAAILVEALDLPYTQINHPELARMNFIVS